MDVATRQFVRQRAGQRCEYCRLPEAADEWPSHVDHIVARVHESDDHPDNLSWSCTLCNLHKATNLASIDPETGNRVNLFNPRLDAWQRHFTIDVSGHIRGLTAAGRAAVRLLEMNGIPPEPPSGSDRRRRVRSVSKVEDDKAVLNEEGRGECLLLDVASTSSAMQESIGEKLRQKHSQKMTAGSFFHRLTEGHADTPGDRRRRPFHCGSSATASAATTCT